jgi:hypothetical protein
MSVNDSSNSSDGLRPSDVGEMLAAAFSKATPIEVAMDLSRSVVAFIAADAASQSEPRRDGSGGETADARTTAYDVMIKDVGRMNTAHVQNIAKNGWRFRGRR